MAVRKKASQQGAARGRFRKGDSPKATEITVKALRGKRETSERGSPETILEEPTRPADPALGNVEVPDSLVHELRLRSTEREKAGTTPWTLQGIVTEALRDWLSKPKNK